MSEKCKAASFRGNAKTGPTNLFKVSILNKFKITWLYAGKFAKANDQQESLVNFNVEERRMKCLGYSKSWLRYHSVTAEGREATFWRSWHCSLESPSS